MASKRKIKTKQHLPEAMPVQSPPPPRIAPSRIPAAVSMLKAARIEFTQANDPNPWRVAGRFNFWPLSGMWATDDYHPMAKLTAGKMGYGVSSLIALIRDEALSPAALDAVAKALDPVEAPKIAAEPAPEPEHAQ